MWYRVEKKKKLEELEEKWKVSKKKKKFINGKILLNLFPYHFQIAVAGLETVFYSTLVIRVVHHSWKKFRAGELVILLLVLQTES